MSELILLVDDKPQTHTIYGEQLEKAGYEVIHAEDGVTAINQAFTKLPDLIILDIQMPKINGYQVCRLLKDHTATNEIPIILMTSEESIGAVADPRDWSFKTGADGYIYKDAVDDVVTEIKSYLKETGVKRRGNYIPMSETEIMMSLSSLLDKQLYLDVSRLSELNERKNAFVANVAHELKSPLSIIKGYAGILSDGGMGPMIDKQITALERIDQTVDRLSRLISDLLDLAQIESGKMQLNLERVDCKKLLNDIMLVYSEAVREKGINVKQEFPEQEVVIQGDVDRLTQVFVNVLNNSVKFTPEGGHITMAVVENNNFVRFNIKDSGPGMKSEYLNKIFDKFVSIKTSKREGTGLGLPIAKDIIIMHKGKIWAESEEGHGSQFIIELPKTARY
jgi:signal transduction histidine kinase